MISFGNAFDLLIDNEGGYSDDPADPGAETMYGVTARVARAHGYGGPMRELPLNTAKAIAKAEYWDRYQCDQMSADVAGCGVWRIISSRRKRSNKMPNPPPLNPKDEATRQLVKEALTEWLDHL